ncbi:hypothetical protein BVX98_01870 [bacterium F11]|nr:hypothetical protein BVX98_01870 [bacterium F11]
MGVDELIRIKFPIALILIVSLGYGPLLGAGIEWLSAPSDQGRQIQGESYHPRLSKNGRFVVFQSKARLTPDDDNRQWDIYMVDRKKKTLSRIKYPGKEYANGAPEISSDGRFVVFHSYSASAVRGEPPRESDIVLFDALREDLTYITSDPNISISEGENLNPVLNKTGKVISFSSDASRFLSRQKNAFRAVYVFDLQKEKLELVSETEEGEPADRQSFQSILSHNGRFVAFKSAATNLDPSISDVSLSFHLYLYDRKKKKMDRIDSHAFGFDFEKKRVGQFAMDGKARFLVFEGFKKDMSDPFVAITVSDLYLFDRKSETITNITKDRFKGGAHSPTLSSDGRYLAFVFRGFEKEDSGGLIIMDRKKNQFQVVCNKSCDNPSFSDDGRFLVFESTDPRWRNGVQNEERHVYLMWNPFNK